MRHFLFLSAFWVSSFAFSQTIDQPRETNTEQNRTTEPSYSVLNVNASPAYYTDVNIAGRFNPVTIRRDGKFFGDGWFSALRATTVSDATFTCALEGTTLRGDYNGTLRSYAVKGDAGGGTHSHRYGMFGSFSGYAGAGVYGTIGNDVGLLLGKPYAGYFNGDSKVNGDLEVKGAVKGWMLRQIPERYSRFPYGQALERLRNFLTISYFPHELGGNYYYYEDKEAEQSTFQYSRLAKQIIEKEHYALKLSENHDTGDFFLYTDEDGNQYINYTELMPLLVQAVQELWNELLILKIKGGEYRSLNRAPSTTALGQQTAPDAQLLVAQNSPNPFNGVALIEMNIPESVGKAELCVYDLGGKLQKVYALESRGKQTFSISATDFEAGMYLYTLIADGQSAATHRMIVTK